MNKFTAMIKNLIEKIREEIKKIKEQLEEEANERYRKKYGLIFQAIEDKVNDVEETLDTMSQQQKLSNERAAAICNVLSELSDRLQDFSPESIEQTTDGVLQKMDKLQKSLNKTLIIKVESFQEMLDRTISPNEQEQFDVRLTSDNKPLIYSRDKAYTIEQTGNAFNMRLLSPEERDAIKWVDTKVVTIGTTLAERAKSAYETAYNRDRNDMQKEYDNLQALAMFDRLQKGDIVSGDLDIRYDAEKQTVFFQDRANRSMIAVSADRDKMSAYYYDKAENFSSDETGIPVFTVSRSLLADGSLKSTGTSFDLKAGGATQDMVQNITKILSDRHMTALTELYHLDDMNDLKQMQYTFDINSKRNMKRIDELKRELDYMSEGKFVVRESRNADGDIAISLRNKGSKDVYMLTFTKDGRHTGYDFISENGTSVIISKTGGVIDEKLAENPNFQYLKSCVDMAMERVNGMEYENFERFERADVNVREVIPVTNNEKRQPILYTEEQLRKQLGDKEFEQALKTATQIVDAVENPKASPDGMEDGFYKEMRGMPKEEQKMLARYIGTALRRNTESLQMNDQQLRAVAFIACQNKSPEEQIKNYESFSTGFMEAVHKAREQKTPEEVGTMLMAEIIIEQNILNEREVFSTEKVETSFVPEEEMTNSVQEQKQEQDYSQHDNPEVQEDIFMQTYDRFAQTIWQNRGKDLPVEVFITEENRAIMDYAVKQELVVKDNDIYHFANVDREVLESIANDFAIERVFSVDEDKAEEFANREEEHDFSSYKQKEVER